LNNNLGLPNRPGPQFHGVQLGSAKKKHLRRSIHLLGASGGFFINREMEGIKLGVAFPIHGGLE
jgi:hypothetical protein